MSGVVYTARPSKDVTRRMLTHAMTRLTHIAAPSRYQYVGFGALEFVDFDLVHREIGIDSMFSIERRAPLDRYEANRPFQNICILHGNSTDVLADISWKGLSIVWLDYESTLNQTVFDDLQHLSSKLIPGSMLALTLNAEPGRLVGRRDRFARLVGEHLVAARWDDDTLGDWGWAVAQQRLVHNKLRNKFSKRSDGATWNQIMNVHYRDDARMQLIAGVVGSPAVDKMVASCRFDELAFHRPSEQALRVDVPYLTPREQLALRAKLPRRPRQRLGLPGVPAEDLKQYEEHYRWIASR